MVEKTLHKRITIVSLVSLLVASIFSVGYHHFDEHFQILEFANYNLGNISAEELPWEFHYQMRPAIQPTMVVMLERFLGMFGATNPFWTTFILRLLSAGLTFFSIRTLYKVLKDRLTDDVLKTWLFVGSFTLWFLIYNGVRFSSENWSGNLFILGFSFCLLENKQSFKHYLLAGSLLGLSFLFRYQSAFLTLGLGLWLVFIRREKLISIAGLAAGFLTIFGVGILVDRWFYGEWTLTTYNYFFQNILEDKVSGFGLEPWWWYFTNTIESAIPPFSLLIVLGYLSLLIFKPKSPLVWVLTPFLLLHSAIGHKELRFLFPIIPLVPAMVIFGIEAAQDKYALRLSRNRLMKGTFTVFLVINFLLLLVVSVKPADSQLPLYHTLYNDYPDNTTLYYINDNPYDRVLNINYYKRDNLTILAIDKIEDIEDYTNALIVFKGNEHLDQFSSSKLVYATYPEWIYHFNFNGWIERSNPWYVYELE